MKVVRGPDSNWGRAVAYHPTLTHFFGSVNAGIFFDQLTYWDGRTENPLGVYKTSEEWTEETGLSYREQATARRILSEPGYLIETNKRLEHRLYFLIDWNVFNPAFRAWSELNRPATNCAPPNCAKRIPPNDENAIRGVLNRQSSIETEITAEITSETTAGRGADAPRAPTMAGAICNVLKALKMQSVNPSHPKLLALIAAGADVGMFADAGRDCVAGGKGFGYLLGMVEGRMNDMAKFTAQALATPAAQRPQAPRPQAESFAERDERARRARWEEMTGEKWPDSTPPVARGDFIDVQATDVRRLA